MAELLEPLAGKTVLIVGAGGGAGSFATQFAANAGASVIANVRVQDAERMRAYGATETIDYAAIDLPDAVRQAHPDGIDVLIDVVDAEAPGFAALASLVRPGGTAVSTNYVADVEALRAAGITGINFALPASSELFERVEPAPDRSARRPPRQRRTIKLSEPPYLYRPMMRCPWPGSVSGTAAAGGRCRGGLRLEVARRIGRWVSGGLCGRRCRAW